MKEEATMLSEEAQRAASILHQTPGWRWRRELCLTERTQHCQSGPTTKAWFHDRCDRVDSDACRGSNVTTRVRNTVRAPARSSARKRRETLAQEATLDACEASSGHVHRAAGEKGGACGWHRQNKIHAGVDSIVSENLADNGVATPRDMRAAPLGDAQMAASQRVRVAPPDSIFWTNAGGTIEAGPSCRSCTASPRRRGVTVPSWIETICDL